MVKHVNHRPGRQRPANPKRVKQELARTGRKAKPAKQTKAQPAPARARPQKFKARVTDFVFPGAQHARKLKSKSKQKIKELKL